jgi:MoaA/NifB/PqqE/SkfB family radical SAM enzyme
VELTNTCNLGCVFCGLTAMTRPTGVMDSHLAKVIIDECSENGAYLQFARWGEPFIHPDIIELAKYAGDKNVPLLITNNGLKITEKQMQQVVDIELPLP